MFRIICNVLIAVSVTKVVIDVFEFATETGPLIVEEMKRRVKNRKSTKK